MTQITDSYENYSRTAVSPLRKALDDAERITDSRERQEAIGQARDDYASGKLKLGYPDVLTKRYRLLWDEKGQLYGDPEEPHEAGSTTAGGPDYCFESDDLKAVRETVKELRLTYSPDSGADLSEDWYEHKKLDH